MNASPTAADSPAAYYDQCVATYQQQAATWTQQSQRVSRQRQGTFAAFVALSLLALFGFLPPVVAWGIGAALVLAFLVFLTRHEHLQQQLATVEQRLLIARTQQARAQRDWAQISVPACESPSECAALSADLDLFGHASAYQLICRAQTPRGRDLVRDWLARPATTDTIRLRQTAVQQLASLRDWREDLDLHGRALSSSQAGPEAFVAWAEGSPWLPSLPWLIPLSRLLVLVWVVALALAVLGWVSAPIATVVILVVLVANLLLSVLLVGRVHEIFNRVDSRAQDVAQYQALFAQVAELPIEEGHLATLRAKLFPPSPAEPADQAMLRLAKIMAVARMRHSAAWGLLQLILQLLLLLDFHVLDRLERWQQRFGTQVRDWFDGLGELEALASLASLHHDFPDWCFPEMTDVDQPLRAEQLGHPLLAHPVCNDVSVGPRGRFLLVSGSNMSGKSTLMRSIGLSAILGQAGGPVCATRLTLPPTDVATSMRVHDSLEEGISFFMAELKRLKEVVAQAEARDSPSGRTVLFLLDEILQGTNSHERQIAVRRVVQRLLQAGAMGAVSTHDLDLAASEELSAACDAIHFRESFDKQGAMTFDYCMREGIATSTNALKLLALVGLD